MKTEYLDFQPEAQNKFPAHGWIRGSTGFRYLRLPILRFYSPGTSFYTHFQERNLAGMWLQFRSPNRTLRQIAVSLRDLHSEIQTLLEISGTDWENQNFEQRTRKSEAYERIEILLTAIFILLRRLGDELIDASRPLLFKNWGSAPIFLKNAIKMAGNKELKNLDPLCNIDILSDALLNNIEWFDRLRKDKDGIRDILVHKQHIIQVGTHGSKGLHEKEFSYTIQANLVQLVNGNPHTTNLMPILSECIAGACRFMARLYQSVDPNGMAGNYHPSDILYITGSSDDTVGFWPSILPDR